MGPSAKPVSEETSARLLGALVSQQIAPQALAPAAWDAVLNSAPKHGLGPMLAWVLEQGGYDVDADPRWRSLVQARRNAAICYVLAHSTQMAVQSALEAASIPCIWIKGAALAPTVYPRPDLRPMIDVDVLVPYSQREAALASAHKLGYRKLQPDPTKHFDTVFHHYSLRGNVSDLVSLEIHYRLLYGDDRILSLRELEWFWAQKLTRVVDGMPVNYLRPEAHLLYLCAHAILQHGEVYFYLLRYFDIHLLLTTESLDWNLIVDQAARLGWTYALERALLLAQSYFSTPIPHGLLPRLRSRRQVSEDLSLAARLRVPHNRWEGAVARLASMTWPTRLRLAGSLLLPSPTYMRWRYGLHSWWQLPLVYLYRWLDIAQEITRTAAKNLPGHSSNS